jgi:hypothetical protein
MYYKALSDEARSNVTFIKPLLSIDAPKCSKDTTLRKKR